MALDGSGAEGLAHTVLRLSEAEAVAEVTAQANIERYAPRELLGEGGMGRVLSAEDRHFGRLVALKELKSHSPGLVARFNVEALVTANLEHPGIPAVYDRGMRTDGLPYYVMRRVAGKTLAEAIDEAKSRTERLRLVSVVTHVARTVGFAHARGVVHRDIKPENVIIGEHGETILLDWGIAKVRGLAGDAEAEGVLERIASGSQQTQVGAVMGTPAYMSPEQALGRTASIDERSDVFALGAMLYNVLTGTAPYAGATAAAVMTAAAQAQFEPIHRRDPSIPKGLQSIVDRAMAREPAERFPTAVDLADALEAHATGALAKQETSLGVRLLIGAGAAGLLILAIISAIVVWTAVGTLRELGGGALGYLTLALLGAALGVVDWSTRGRHQLAPLVAAFAGCTVLGGIAVACLGELRVMATAAEVAGNELEWQRVVSLGTWETLGNVPASLCLAMPLIALWALARRRALTSSASA